MVSVLVPIYNAQSHLRQCVDSILNQTYTQIELILFNDASKDRSLEICREYAAKDRRVRVIDSQENVGVYNGRLKALEFINGDFFIQVDSDDWIAKDYIQTALEYAEKFNVDLVAMGFQRTMDSRGLLKQAIRPYKEMMYVIFNDTQTTGIYTQRVFSNNMWSKLFRTEVVRNRHFSPSDIHFGDDLLFLQEISPYIRSIYSLPVCKYYYRYGGSTSHYNPRFWIDQSKLYWLRKAYALEREPEYVAGLKLYLLDTFKDVVKYRLFLNNSVNKRNETIEFLKQFYSTEEYKEFLSIEDCQDEFFHLLRSKDSEGIICYLGENVSRISILKTKLLSAVSRMVSAW